MSPSNKHQEKSCKTTTCQLLNLLAGCRPTREHGTKDRLATSRARQQHQGKDDRNRTQTDRKMLDKEIDTQRWFSSLSCETIFYLKYRHMI
ncbi:hypothetical protein V6N12_040735 [Hibiscus sabdariffa]|uniref:Uncharacterized protein n=1 Tax=Hibiscus sabdariffa TaxID=183260 RepID=A0ABR2E4L8_9ROSI